jgi:thiol-disulfide isomerase/thioredoxin
MKKLLVVGTMVIMAACSSNKQSYIIEGTAPDSTYNGKMVYMKEYEYNQTVDSAEVFDGKFTFKGAVDTAVIRRLDLKWRLYANLILEKGTITVDMSNPISAKGTELNNGLRAYSERSESYSDSISNIISEIRQRTDIDDVEAQVQEQVASYYGWLDSFCGNLFSANKNNAFGLYILWGWSFELTPEKMDSLYAIAGDIVRNNKVLTNIIEKNKHLKQTAEGMPFIDFTIENGNVDSSSVSFSEYVGKGKYVLVDFWASWCGPCIQETPVIAEVYNKYKGNKFDVLSVAVFNDKREFTLAAIEKHKMTWSHIVDANRVPMDIYGIDGIPHIILFAPDGTIVARNLRGDDLKAKVAEVLR